MTQQKELTQRKVIRHGSEDIQTIYSNNVEIRGTQWDIRLTFGELINVTDEAVEVKNKAAIYMSPQHAKVFAAALISNIQKHEQLFGKISISDESAVDDSSEQRVSAG